MSPPRPRGIVVAIDGPAGAGKSTVSRELARRLGYVYVDTGALYRVVGLLARDEGLAADDGESLGRLARSIEIRFEPTPEGDQRVIANGRDVTREIRQNEIGQWASRVSAQPAVREALLEVQRDIGRDGGAVIEGRDIGTIVFPDAERKFFLVASAEERADRRYRELRARGEDTSYEDVLREMRERDARDSGREHAPLLQAPDAESIDSSGKTVDEILTYMEQRCRISP